MNINKVTDELKEKYPGKKIVKNKETNPTEVICEIDPAEGHPRYSTAVAVIDRTEPHYHRQAAEIYYVLKGTLTLYKGEGKEVLKEGDFSVIKPEEHHAAEGNETWVLVYSEPGWSVTDHFMVKEEKEQIEYSFTHVRLLVDRFPECFRFYRDVLGLHAVWGDEHKDYAEFSTGATMVSLFKKELMEKSLDKGGAKLIAQKGNSALLNLKVEDVDKAAGILMDRKVTFVNGPADFPKWGVRAAHFTDPSGNLIEIYQNLRQD